MLFTSASRRGPSSSTSLETLVDDALEETPNHSRWMAFHWQPLQSTYHIALATALSDTLGLPPRLLVLFLFLGRCFLSFLHRGQGRRKLFTLLFVVALLMGRISFENGGCWQAHSRRDA